MRLLFILFVLFPMLGYAQNGACDSYNAMIKKAEAAENSGGYPLALELYNTARIMAKSCTTAKEDIKAKLAEISGKINNQEKAKATAVADKQKAEKETAKEQQLRKDAEEAKTAAEIAKIAAQLAEAAAKTAKDEALRQEKIAQQLAKENRMKQLQSVALLFATTSKKTIDIGTKRTFFKHAYELSQDSVKNSAAIFSNPSMIEAAYEAALNSTKDYLLDSSQSLYAYSQVNGLALSADGKQLYLAGGNGRITEAALAATDSVHRPSVQWKQYNTAAIPCLSKDIRFCSQKMNDLVLSPDGTLVAAAGESEQIMLFRNGEFQAELSPNALHPKAYINALAFLDKELLASVGTDSRLVIYNINTKEQTAYNLQGLPLQLKYIPDYNGGVVLISTTKGVEILSLSNKKMTTLVQHPESTTAHYAVLDAKSQKLFVAYNKKLTVYQLNADGTIKSTLPSQDIEQDVVDMVYDGELYLMLGYESGLVQLWVANEIQKTETTAIRIQSPAKPLARLAYYPKGRQIITTGKESVHFLAIDVKAIYHYLQKEKLAKEMDKELYDSYLKN